mgnify:CR=1 FL=1
MLDENEFERWMKSARATLKSAEGDLERGDYNWACFKAQQAAEFAIKALLHGLGLPAYGHSISKLLTKLPRDLAPQRDLIQAAKTLDKYYVPTRYVNAWAEGTPEDYRGRDRICRKDNRMGDGVVEIINRRRKEREAVIKTASEWASKLPFEVTAILVGSYARGDFNLWSDVDIVLISPRFKGNPLERLKDIDAPPAFQIIPLTPGEFQKLLSRRNPLATEAVTSGVPLRDDLKLLQNRQNETTQRPTGHQTRKCSSSQTFKR